MKALTNQIRLNNTNTIMSLIYTNFDDKTYLYSNDLDNCKSDLYVPLCIDTEFYNRPLDDPLLAVNPSQTITVQIKGVNESVGKIYTHKDSQDIARHKLFSESFIGFQYLMDNGYPIIYHRPSIITNKLGKSLPTHPKIHFHLYLHFACADLIRVFYGDYKNDVRQLILNAKGSGNNQGITQNRRLQTYFRGNGGYKNQCFLNWLVDYQGIEYQVVLSVYDTIAIAGNKSYLDLADLVGHNLPYKNLLNEQDKSNMIDTYLNDENFDNYALGDLYAYDLLLKFDNQYKSLLQSTIGIKEDEKLTARLTIGSSIARILSHQLKSFLNDKKMFSELTKNANSDNLRKEKDTRAILSKVDGGRCYNNRPLDTIVNKEGDYQTIDQLVKGLNLLCDVDISGAYGKGLSLQDYPLGKPKNFCHQLDKDNNYLTLREFLDTGKVINGYKVKGVRSQLVDGLWIMRVSTIKPLKHPQDLISSWVIDPKKIDRLTDPVGDDLSVDYPKEGYCKIFTNQINLGLITSDILQWIDNICSRDQRKEFYDNLLVVNAIWYDKTKELNNVKDVEKYLKEFDEKDVSYYESDDLISIQKNSYYWCRVNLGDLLINELIKTRNKYPKKEYPQENEFYKLCINTSYGVLVSKFFDISNTVVGNNITARCRCMIWYLEKGLNGFQSITDGCVFELDNVTYPVDGKRLTANNLVKGYQNNIRDRQWKTDKLKINNYRKIVIDDKEHFIEESKFLNNLKATFKELTESSDDNVKINFNELKDYYVRNNKSGNKENLLRLNKYPLKYQKFTWLIDELAKRNIPYPKENFYNIELDILEHLRNIFPNVDVLHKEIINNEGIEQIGYYTLEIKSFAKKAIFHGNANYYLEGVKELKKDTGVLESPINKKTGEIKDKIIKMRGYVKNCYVFESNQDLDYLEDHEQSFEEHMLSETDDYMTLEGDITLLGINIPEKFFNSLKNDLTRVTRQDYFIENKIIKCKDFKNNYNTYKHYNIDIGYSIPELKLLTELVLSQFTYPDIKSYRKWIDNHYSHKGKYGHGYESCFLNDDGSLNYQLMIETIDQKIKDGKSIKLKNITHPNFETKELRKDDIQNRLIV